MTEFDKLKEVFDWSQISCAQFPKMLWHNSVTGVYKHDGVIVEANDERLIEYKSKSKDMKPVNLW